MRNASKKHMKNVYFTSWIICCLFGSIASKGYAHSEIVGGSPAKSEVLPLDVVVKTDKSIYKIGSTVDFQISLINRSNRPIFVYADMEEGESASYSIWLKDVNSGEDVDAVFLADSLTPQPHSKDDFIEIPPNYFYGVIFSTSLARLSINKPGTYRVEVYYHSPISGNMSFGLPIWSRESGIITSSPIQIRVEKNQNPKTRIKPGTE